MYNSHIALFLEDGRPKTVNIEIQVNVLLVLFPCLVSYCFFPLAHCALNITR